jgi:hypothetical protein
MLEDLFPKGAIDRRAVLNAARRLRRQMPDLPEAKRLEEMADQLGLDFPTYVAEWAAIRHVCVELAKRHHLEAAERFASRNPRAVLAVTLAGSVLSGGRSKSGSSKRDVRYTPMGSRDEAPEPTEHRAIVLDSIKLGQHATISAREGTTFTSTFTSDVDTILVLDQAPDKLHQELVAAVASIQGRKPIKPPPKKAPPPPKKVPQRATFAGFRSAYGRSAQAQPAPALVRAYGKRVPPAVAAFWKKFGVGGFGDGLFSTIDPRPFEKVISRWGDHKKYPVVACTAFGDLFFWSDYAKEICFLDTSSGRVDLLGRPERFLNEYFSHPKIVKAVLHKKLFDDARRRLGPLAAGECYAFSQPLALAKPGARATRKANLLEELAARRAALDSGGAPQDFDPLDYPRWFVRGATIVEDSGNRSRIREIVRVGKLLIRSGKLMVFDLADDKVCALAERVPNGDYLVEASRVAGSGRFAGVRIQLKKGKVARWELARYEAPRSEAKTFPVDAGAACYCDSATFSIYEDADWDTSFYDDVVHRAMGKRDFCVAEVAKGHAIPIVSTGGDGTFPNYWGRDASGKPLCLVTDFYQLFGPRLP